MAPTYPTLDPATHDPDGAVDAAAPVAPELDDELPAQIAAMAEGPARQEAERKYWEFVNDPTWEPFTPYVGDDDEFCYPDEEWSRDP